MGNRHGKKQKISKLLGSVNADNSVIGMIQLPARAISN
jgi:hypothetical protein